jgi:quercetin dioxygenase-like cupin family protein
VPVTKHAGKALTRRPGGPSSHTVVPPTADGWTDVVLTEWELRAESWTDRHPHSEYNYVLDGLLFVESDGETVQAHPGDVVFVSPGSVGRYWTPTYARLLAVYGPNPSAEPSEILGLGSADGP